MGTEIDTCFKWISRDGYDQKLYQESVVLLN